MERAVEGGQAAAYPEFGFSAGGRVADSGLATAHCTEGEGRGRPKPHRTRLLLLARILHARHDSGKFRGGEGGGIGIGGGGKGVGGGMVKGDAHTFIRSGLLVS